MNDTKSKDRALPATSERVLRARRLKADSFPPGALTASFSLDGTEVSGVLRDVSLHGASIYLAADSGLVRIGQRIEQLRIRFVDRTIYEGDAIVRFVGEGEERLILGISLSGEMLDLRGLYREFAGESFRSRWAKLQEESRLLVSERLQAEVLSLRQYLFSVATFFDREEERIRIEDHYVRRREAEVITQEACNSFQQRLHEFCLRLNEEYIEMGDKERAAIQALCIAQLGPFFHRSNLVRRAYEKPLGYAGDYEVMNFFYDRNLEEESMFGWLVSEYIRTEEATVANINRVPFLVEKIKDAARVQSDKGGGRRLRVASIGSGPAQEVRHLLQSYPEIGPRLHISLMDQEERAIRYCENTLAPMARDAGAEVVLIADSVARISSSKGKSTALGEQDLIYSAGLFDYLSDRSFVRLGESLYGSLASEGRLYIGNVSERCTTRALMECVGGWFLEYRTEKRLEEIASKFVPDRSAFSIMSEPLGINLFIAAHK